MNEKVMVVEYQFNDPTMNVVVDNPSEDEVAFVSAMCAYDGHSYPNYGGLMNNIGITGIKITAREWRWTDLFTGGTHPDDPIMPKAL